MSYLPTVKEEAKHYLEYFGYRAKKFHDYVLPPPPTETPQQAFLGSYNAQKMFKEGTEEEEDGWVEVTDASHDAPQETKQDVIRLAKEGGPMQQCAQKLQKDAIETALQAAGVTGQLLRNEINVFVYNTGWLCNCDTVDEAMKKVLAKYPVLKTAGPALKELKSSFVQGRQLAARNRKRSVGYQTSTQNQMGPVKRLGIYEAFAELEEVPVEEDELEEEPLDLGDDINGVL